MRVLQNYSESVRQKDPDAALLPVPSMRNYRNPAYFDSISPRALKPLGTAASTGTCWRCAARVSACLVSTNLQSLNLPPLSGLVDDCCCSVSDTQHVNDNYIARSLDALVKKPFFRFFKVNLDKECPFWAVEKTCGTNGGCDVCHCNADEIPVSWRQTASDAVTRGGAQQWTDGDGDMWLPPEEGSTSYVDLTKNRCGLSQPVCESLYTVV